MVLTHIKALRAWSALSVVLFHLGGSVSSPEYFDFPAFSYFTSFGYSGMFLFFVLSGFIIHQVHAEDLGRPERIIRYIKKRVFRIFPLYILVLFIISIFSKISGIGADGLPHDLTTIARTILLLPQDPEIVGGTGAPVIIVAWSLQYEMIFYAIFSFFIVSPFLGMICVTMLTLAWLFFYTTGQNGIFPSYLEFKYFTFFIMGVITSMISRKGLTRSSADILRFGAVCGFVAAFILSVISNIMIQIDLMGFLSFQFVLGGLAAALILGVSEAERHGAPPAGTILCNLGDWSYAIYLIHFPVISGVNKVLQYCGFDHMEGAMLALFASLVVTIAVARLLYNLVERPGMLLARDSQFFVFGMKV